MLNKLPTEGQFVRVLEDGFWDDTGERYQTKGEMHEIEGVSDVSGNPYFIGDLGRPIYIDDAAFDLYEIVEDIIQ